MTTIKFESDPQSEGLRIDTFLSRRLDKISRSAIQRLILSGYVIANEKPVKKNHIVSADDVFHVRIPEPEPISLVPQDIPLDIVYEDGDVIVVNKPRGMVVHPAPGHPDGTLVNALMYHCGDTLSGINGEIRPGIIHRIDKDTSGLIIAAKNDFAHISLAAQLTDHSLSRVYEAIACGRVKEDTFTISAPIGRHLSDRKKMCVTQKNSRSAITHIEVIARYSGYTHVRCRLETGRTHQIRVHMAYTGHPILGDLVYGRKKPEKGISGQCLHARTIRFSHPVSGKAIELTTALPEYFTDVIDKLGGLV